MDKQKAVRKEKEGAFVDLLNQEMKELQESMKQKQIEEMAKDLVTAFTKPLEKCLYPKSVDCVKEECERFNPQVPCRFIGIAENIYDAGCRKIPENAVMLTREDFETEKQMANYWKERAKMWKQAAHDIRKETAEKLLDKIDYESNGQTKSITELLRKEYGVYDK